MRKQKRGIPAKLVNLSQRLPIYYAERCKVFVRDEVLVISDAAEGRRVIPAAMVGALLLGPGCSITTEAARLAAENGLVLVFSGGGGVPSFSQLRFHRSALPMMKQFEIVLNPEKRIKAAMVLLEARAKVVRDGTYDLPELRLQDASSDSLQSLLGFEAAWVKRAYHTHAKRLGVTWTGKRDLNDKKHPLILLNHFCYSIANVVIEHLGLSANLGVLHGRTRGGGFAYDLADVIKPELALGPGLVATLSENLSRPGKVKESFLADVRRIDAFAQLVSTVQKVLAIAGQVDDEDFGHADKTIKSERDNEDGTELVWEVERELTEEVGHSKKSVTSKVS